MNNKYFSEKSPALNLFLDEGFFNFFEPKILNLKNPIHLMTDSGEIMTLNSLIVSRFSFERELKKGISSIMISSKTPNQLFKKIFKLEDIEYDLNEKIEHQEVLSILRNSKDPRANIVSISNQELVLGISDSEPRFILNSALGSLASFNKSSATSLDTFLKLVDPKNVDGHQITRIVKEYDIQERIFKNLEYDIDKFDKLKEFINEAIINFSKSDIYLSKFKKLVDRQEILSDKWQTYNNNYCSTNLIEMIGNSRLYKNINSTNEIIVKSIESHIKQNKQWKPDSFTLNFFSQWHKDFVDDLDKRLIESKTINLKEYINENYSEKKDIEITEGEDKTLIKVSIPFRKIILENEDFFKTRQNLDISQIKQRIDNIHDLENNIPDSKIIGKILNYIQKASDFLNNINGESHKDVYLTKEGMFWDLECKKDKVEQSVDFINFAIENVNKEIIMSETNMNSIFTKYIISKVINEIEETNHNKDEDNHSSGNAFKL